MTLIPCPRFMDNFWRVARVRVRNLTNRVPRARSVCSFCFWKAAPLRLQRKSRSVTDKAPALPFGTSPSNTTTHLLPPRTTPKQKRAAGTGQCILITSYKKKHDRENRRAQHTAAAKPPRMGGQTAHKQPRRGTLPSTTTPVCNP